MGGTGWTYRTLWRGSITASFEALREEVFAGGEFQYSPAQGGPQTLQELTSCLLRESTCDEDDLEGGTHSILDIYEVHAPEQYARDVDNRNHHHRLYPLTHHELVQLFGTDRPTTADWARLEEDGTYYEVASERWTARCVVLRAGDQPDEVAFWGSSGY